MGLMDNMEDKAKEAMNDPQQKARIEQMAKDKGISMEQAAREHMANRDSTGQ